MRIVLATSPPEDDTHGVRSLPPLSLAYLAASLKKLPGVSVHIVDAYGEGLNTVKTAERLLALEPDLIGVSSTSFCFEAGLRLVKAMKTARPEIFTLMGGYHPTFFDSLLLRETPELDYVIRGEGDESLPALCRRLMAGEPVDGLPGLSYRNSDGEIVRGVPQQVMDLDSLPFPDREALEYTGYFFQFGGFYLPKLPRTATVVTSRGCPYHCSFCPKLFEEWGYRIRSAENVFAEVKELYKKGYEVVFFQDENFSHNVERLEKFCNMVLASKMNLRFAFQGTIHHLPEHIFPLLHKAGFDCLFVGVESGSDAQLKRYRKPGTHHTLGEAIRRAKRAHMLVIGFFIHGGPGETMEDSRQTQHFIRKFGPHVTGASELSVQPGTILWQELLNGMEPADIRASCPKRISHLPGQHSKEDIKAFKTGFMRALALSWWNWRRARDLYDLLVYNKTIRRGLRTVIADFKPVRQLFKGGPKGKYDPRNKPM